MFQTEVILKVFKHIGLAKQLIDQGQNKDPIFLIRYNFFIQLTSVATDKYQVVYIFAFIKTSFYFAIRFILELPS